MRGIESRYERDKEGDRRDKQAVDESRGERDIIDGVDLGGEADDLVVTGEDAGGVAENQTENRADDSDEDSLEHKYAANLTGPGAHGDEDGDVFGFLHDHHDERDEDIEGGDEDDESDG